MKTPLKWLQFLRPSVQRDLVALVVGCASHPTYRAIRRKPTGCDGNRLLYEPLVCERCIYLYAAKQRVKGLLK